MLVMQRLKEGVFVTQAEITSVGNEEIAFLKQKAEQLPRKRARLCIHKDLNDLVHEMIIVVAKGYIQPHSHTNKGESFYAIEGNALVVLFTDEGEITGLIRLNGEKDGYSCCHIPAGTCHTLFIESEWFVFYEITSGPFKPENTISPTWAPEEKDTVAVAQFLEGIQKKIVGAQ